MGESREWSVSFDLCKGRDMEYGETLKPGDKALLKLPRGHCMCGEARELDGKVVTVLKLTWNKKGWWIEGQMWFRHERFHPVPESYNKRTLPSDNNSFCGCASPDLITNVADGKEFQYCRSCKKERL